jgi:hypothetical protein
VFITDVWSDRSTAGVTRRTAICIRVFYGCPAALDGIGIPDVNHASYVEQQSISTMAWPTIRGLR